MRQAEIAKHLGISIRVTRDLIAKGTIPKGPDLDAVRAAYCHHLREVAAGRARTAGPLDPQQAKARLDHARAEREELRLSVERGELVRLDEISIAMTDTITIARNRLLGLPSALASACAEQPADRVFAEARRVIYSALEELSDDILRATTPQIEKAKATSARRY